MLDAAFGEDFGLAAQPGFSVTGDFIQATTGPSGQPFNYADCNTRRGASFAMIYLAKKFGRSDWFDAVERKLFADVAAARPKSVERGGNRLLPLALLYLDIPAESGKPPLSYYSGDRVDRADRHSALRPHFESGLGRAQSRISGRAARPYGRRLLRLRIRRPPAGRSISAWKTIRRSRRPVFSSGTAAGRATAGSSSASAPPATTSSASTAPRRTWRATRKSRNSPQTAPKWT